MNHSRETLAHGGGAAISDGDDSSSETSSRACSEPVEVAAGQETRLRNTFDYEWQALNDVQSAVSALVGQWQSVFPDHARKYDTRYRTLGKRHWQLRFAVPAKEILTICMFGWMRPEYRRAVESIGLNLLKPDAWSRCGAELQLDVYGHLELPPLNGPLTIDNAVPHLRRWHQVQGGKHRAATKRVSTSTVQTCRWLTVTRIAGS